MYSCIRCPKELSEVLILTVEIGSMLLIIQGDRERLLLMGPKKLKGETTHLFLGNLYRKFFWCFISAKCVEFSMSAVYEHV